MCVCECMAPAHTDGSSTNYCIFIWILVHLNSNFAVSRWFSFSFSKWLCALTEMIIISDLLLFHKHPFLIGNWLLSECLFDYMALTKESVRKLKKMQTKPAQTLGLRALHCTALRFCFFHFFSLFAHVVYIIFFCNDSRTLSTQCVALIEVCNCIRCCGFIKIHNNNIHCICGFITSLPWASHQW